MTPGPTRPGQMLRRERLAQNPGFCLPRGGSPMGTRKAPGLEGTPRTTVRPEATWATSLPPSLPLPRRTCVSITGAGSPQTRAPASWGGGWGTSGITYWPAMSRAPSRFSRPSLHSAWMGTWEGARSKGRGSGSGSGVCGPCPPRTAPADATGPARPFPSLPPLVPTLGGSHLPSCHPQGPHHCPAQPLVPRAPRSSPPRAGRP